MRKNTRRCRKCGIEKVTAIHYQKGTTRIDIWCKECRATYKSSRYSEFNPDIEKKSACSQVDTSETFTHKIPEFKFEPKDTAIKPNKELKQDGYYFIWS